MPQVRSYTQLDAPEAEVLWDGRWCFGTLHEWRQDEEGRWTGWVRFSAAQGETRNGVFDQDHIRPAT